MEGILFILTVFFSLLASMIGYPSIGLLILITGGVIWAARQIYIAEVNKYRDDEED